MNDYDFLLKIVVIGDSEVGKSCLVLRFADNVFKNHYTFTVGVDFKIKTINHNGQRIKLQIWDTAGNERFKSISTNFYRGAHGIVLVYSCTDLKSFENINNWLGEIRKYADGDVTKLLIGNKSDASSERVVDQSLAQDYAESLNMPFLEASAKDSSNVDEAFEILVDEIMKNKFHLSSYQQHASSIDISNAEQVHKTKCCRN